MDDRRLSFASLDLVHLDGQPILAEPNNPYPESEEMGEELPVREQDSTNEKLEATQPERAAKRLHRRWASWD